MPDVPAMMLGDPSSSPQDTAQFLFLLFQVFKATCPYGKFSRYVFDIGLPDPADYNVSSLRKRIAIAIIRLLKRDETRKWVFLVPGNAMQGGGEQLVKLAVTLLNTAELDGAWDQRDKGESLFLDNLKLAIFSDDTSTLKSHSLEAVTVTEDTEFQGSSIPTFH